jgi:hypothetical protein
MQTKVSVPELCKAERPPRTTTHVARAWDGGNGIPAPLPLFPQTERESILRCRLHYSPLPGGHKRQKSDSLSPDDVQDADEKGQLPKGCHRKRGFGRTGLLASVQCDSTSLFFEACKCKGCLTRRNTLIDEAEIAQFVEMFVVLLTA